MGERHRAIELITEVIALGVVVISLLKENTDFLGLTAHCLDMMLDLVLLRVQSLFKLHFVAFAVAESS